MPKKRNIFFSQTGAATSLLPPPAHPPFFSISTLIFSTSHSCWFCKVPASQTKITNPPNILYPKKPKPKPQPHNPNTEKSGNPTSITSCQHSTVVLELSCETLNLRPLFWSWDCIDTESKMID